MRAARAQRHRAIMTSTTAKAAPDASAASTASSTMAPAACTPSRKGMAGIAASRPA
jgi:hypothetical protein